MEEALGIVIFAVVALASVVALITFAGTGKAYDEVGKGGFYREEPSGRRAGGGAAPLPGERDDEIRQMLRARNERRERAGKPPIDVEEELQRLTAPAADPELVAEVRSLVLARNERRERQGKEPLDVEAEVARQLRDLGV